MPETESWTIARLLKWTADYLKSRGSESPRLDAEVLLAYARDCERIGLYTAFDETPGPEIRDRFRALVKRRAEGMPVAYLVGHREFYSLRFRVTRDVLIPRPETELLVVALLDLVEQLGPADHPLEIVDIGTGSGIIAVCAAKYIPTSHVTAIDVSRSALEIAWENARTHSVDSRIAFRHSDLLADLEDDRQFDFVVSNPPYISDAEFAALAKDVRDYEPHQALLAGPSGTEVIARLIPQAALRLSELGWLMMEISPMLADRTRELIRESGQFGAPRLRKDLAGHPRIVMAQRLARS